ncbi:MAG: hypothetical protein FGM14_12425 [Flavobacteriales bacterium]|nr:hypothetical protein [Flavobacteriales bacterium]
MFKYILDSSAEPKVIGVRDGGSQIVLSDKNQNDSTLKKFLWPKSGWPDLKIDNLSKYESELNFNLKKQAKITDFLSHSPYIHIIGIFSANFINLLQKFKLNEHIVFKEVFVYRNNEKIQEKYFLIQQPILNKEVDRSNTFFYKPLQRDINSNEICFKFKDESHYLGSVSSIRLSRISFNKAEIYDYDFVSSLTDDFVSDRLAKAIEEANFTNIVLKNLDSINCSEVIPHE